MIYDKRCRQRRRFHRSRYMFVYRPGRLHTRLSIVERNRRTFRSPGNRVGYSRFPNRRNPMAGTVRFRRHHHLQT